MLIALPTRDGLVDEHFGHCDHFTIFDVQPDGTINSREELVPPPGCGCKSNIVTDLAARGVTVMLAGNMGQGAVNKLAQHGITTLRGCSGPLEDIVLAYLAGKLVPSGIVCAGHDGHGGHGHDGCGH